LRLYTIWSLKFKLWANPQVYASSFIADGV
jgi:hypothetical protein